jgi:hypothetical protein
MKSFLLTLCFIFSCTSAQKDFKSNLYVDLSLDGDFESTEVFYQSVGVSYPLWWDLWASAGLWTNLGHETGTYWGVSYSFAPFE